MEEMGSEGELSSGYKLVPWSSWDQWNFVRESIFSSSPHSVSKALQKVSAWRSRGCLPVPIDVTAAIIEIQQKDPHFREGCTVDAVNSEEMLAMLYCMAITRLVNGFVEPAHKKTGRSISDLADEVGIPRMLVDIRHESSHRDLPSLRLVRLASRKALDWLISNYWEPQRRVIPDVRKEIRSRLHEMSFLLRTKHTQRVGSSQIKGKRAKISGVIMRCNKLSSQITGKLQTSKSNGSVKKISKITKIIARLYSSYPSEVVSVLLEFFHLQAPDFSDDTDMEHSDDSDVDDPGPLVGSLHDLKIIIIKLSSKRPALILSILKTVLEMIEAKESTLHETDSPRCHDGSSDIDRLCSLVPWLLRKLKELKDSGQIELVGEAPVLSTDPNTTPKVSLVKLLRKCLTLSVLGDKHLSNSVLPLVEMIRNNCLTEKFKKLPLLCSRYQDCGEDSATTFHDAESILLKEEDSIKQATEKLEHLKSRLKNRISRTKGRNVANRAWTVAKSWTPCPIGMLPCSFSSTAVLPVLDQVDETLESSKVEISSDQVLNDHPEVQEFDLPEISEEDVSTDENGSTRKRSRTTKDQWLDSPEATNPMEGRLLIGGVWKKVSEEELLAIESTIRIFV